MKETEVSEKLTDLTEALTLIAVELQWILDESNKRNVQPETPLAEEFLQKFFQLYRDFQKIRKNLNEVAEEIHNISFTDKTMNLVYTMVVDFLVKKSEEGIFGQFISVAEHGCLPDGTTFDDLST